MPQPLELIAHRGASSDAPENTLAAVALAWRQGADAVEADFRLTRDGHIVASHDDSLLRLAGVDLRIAEHTLDELRRCDVGRWKGPQWAGQQLPTLEELLAVTPPRGRFYVEVKCGLEIAEPLAEVVHRSRLAEEHIVLICFSASVLSELQHVLPGSPTYLVVEFLRDPHSGVWYPDAHERLTAAVSHRLTGLDLMAARAADPELLERTRAAGLDLCVWTVDEPGEAARLIELGVRRITTNRPGWLRAQLKQLAAP